LEEGAILDVFDRINIIHRIAANMLDHAFLWNSVLQHDYFWRRDRELVGQGGNSHTEIKK
jgi:hypothetical protein